MSIEFELGQISGRTVAVIDPELRSNAGAVALNKFVVAIDPTMRPPAAAAFRQKLERQFGMPVKFLLVTHYHHDHVFGVAPFKDTCIIGSIELTANILKRKDAEWSPEALERWKQNEPPRMPAGWTRSKSSSPHWAFATDWRYAMMIWSLNSTAPGGTRTAPPMHTFPMKKWCSLAT